MSNPSRSTAGMTDIACLIRVAEETPVAAMKQAIALACASGAHLSAALAIQAFTAPYTPFWTSMTSSIVAEVNATSRSKAASIAETFKAEAAAAGVSLDLAMITGALGDIAEKAALAARAADLIVVDQPHGALDSAEVLLEEALFRSGRPVVVASPRVTPPATLKKAVVGWDGSAHAVRAVSDALFLFPELKALEIVTVSGEKDLSKGTPAADFARHLARRGLDVTLTDILLEGRTVGAVLDAYAQEKRADALIMGAFGHSRLREFLLGGVTVELTENAATPLFMAY